MSTYTFKVTQYDEPTFEVCSIQAMRNMEVISVEDIPKFAFPKTYEVEANSRSYAFVDALEQFQNDVCSQSQGFAVTFKNDVRFCTGGIGESVRQSVIRGNSLLVRLGVVVRLEDGMLYWPLYKFQMETPIDSLADEVN